MLALIMRFVNAHEQLDVSDEAYFQRQVETLQAYVDQFPKAERQTRALEWVEQHAENYRRSWQRKQVTETAHKRRCADCPLKDYARSRNCSVHGRWLGLLNRYLTNELTSAQYVEDTLRLLRAHKSELRIAQSNRAAGACGMMAH
jgi:hypothetical protein